MPWTRKQVKKLLSSDSPLTQAQMKKMKGELHDDPLLGHAKKRGRKPVHNEVHTYNFRDK